MASIGLPPTGELFTCEACSKSFTSRGRYNQHQRTHSKPFQCDRCPTLSFALRSDLKRHINGIHRIGKETFPCKISSCNFRATRKDNVAQHLEKIHGVMRQKRDNEKMSRIKSRAKSRVSYIQTPIHYSLMQAAEMGNILYLRGLLDSGADPSAKADDGSTAFHCAAKAGQIDAANLLLQQIEDLEIRNAQERTPLYEAAASDRQLFVRWLLELGANPSSKDTTGQSILQYVVAHDMVSMLDLFVRTLGTSCLNQNQSPPLLHIAAKSKTSARTLEHLLQYQDIDVNIREADISALYWAVKCGNEDGTRMLLSHKDVDTQGIQKLGMLYDKAPLHIAAKSGHEAITEMLLGCPGIDLNVRDLSSRTPLSYAARFANSSLIKLLLAQEDTDTSISDGNGWAPFHEALKRGDEAIVMLFLERDDIKMRHQKDMEDIVLRTTASPGHTELLKSLLDQKIIRTEAVNSSSQTPLHHAARWGNMDAMCLLLNDKNIHPLNSADKRGETPLHIALRFGKGKVAQQLLSYNGIQLDTTNKKGQTLLHAAARGGHVEPAKLILQRKIIDLNHKDIEGDTALHVAIQWGHVEVAKLLLEDKSVALDVVTDSGMTLLHCAMDPFFPRSPQLDLLRMFLDRNVIDVNARMNSKHRDPTRHFVTALDLAKRLWWYRISDANREAIIQLLKAHGATESTSKDIPETSEITSNEVPDPETFQANINTAIEFPDSNLSVEAEDLDPDVEMGTDPFMGYGDSSCCDDSD